MLTPKVPTGFAIPWEGDRFQEMLLDLSQENRTVVIIMTDSNRRNHYRHRHRHRHRHHHHHHHHHYHHHYHHQWY